MRGQLLAIIWAQFRITRNHFPRTSFGTLLSWCVSGLWYLMFVVIAMLTARALQHVPAEYLDLALSSGLFAIFVYMQVVPLVTMSTGWSLEIDKLEAFPLRTNTLFLVEVVLRFTSAPEMLLLLCGAFAGLLLRTDIFPLAPFFLLLYIPFSLLLQLAIRDFILHSFRRNRFREVLTVLLLAVALLPQLLIRERTIHLLKPYAMRIANGAAAPWHQIAVLSLGKGSFYAFAAVLGWNLVAGFLARRQFMKSLRRENAFRSAPLFSKTRRTSDIISLLTGHLSDPFAALVEKELRTLVRMPRIRVVFGMACVFSTLVFLPLALDASEKSFIAQNSLPVTSLYGLLLLSDALLLNIFGFDHTAAQLYFATPPAISLVIRAKNLAAILLVALQSLAVPLLAMLFHMPVSGVSLLAGLLSSAAVTVFLLSAGNMLSVYMPRPIDPQSAFRKQGGTRVQLWLLLCTVGMFLLIGFAFFARWATDQEWVLPAILSFELLVGLLIYRISLESTLEHMRLTQERILADLSRSVSPLSSD